MSVRLEKINKFQWSMLDGDLDLGYVEDTGSGPFYIYFTNEKPATPSQLHDIQEELKRLVTDDNTS